MPESVDIPVVGSTKKSTMYILLAAVGGIVVFAWWSARGSTATVEDATTDVPPDELPAGPGSVSSGGGQTDTGQEFITTNAEWVQAVTMKLIDLGYDPIMIATALGKFFSRAQVSNTEADLIRAALALQGNPPVGVWSIVQGAAQPGPSPSQTGVTIPPAPKTLNVQKISDTRWLLTWSLVPSATSYELRSITGHTGDVVRTTTVPTYLARVGQKGGHLAFEVRSKNSAGRSGWIRRTVVGK